MAELDTELVLRAGHLPSCGEGAEFPWDCTCDYSGFMDRMGVALALDAAWAEVEAALPGPDWSILMGDGRDQSGYGYWATASHRNESIGLTVIGGKRNDGQDTPAAALLFLAEKLREHASKVETGVEKS